MNLYRIIKNYASTFVVGENTDRAILLAEDKVFSEQVDDAMRYHIIPSSGRQGKPVTVIKKSGKRYDFGADTAALYEHNVFAYESGDSIIMIFHRQNGSGCKSVFLETANRLLKTKGFKFDMELIIPMEADLKKADPKCIMLQFVKDNASSDIAENIKGKKKKVVVKELALNLEVDDNNKIFKIFKNMQLGKISREEAFATIKGELKDGEDYNDAEVKLKIGGRSKKIKWNEFEHILGVYDITDELHSVNSNQYIETLKGLSDDYYKQVRAVLED